MMQAYKTPREFLDEVRRVRARLAWGEVASWALLIVSLALGLGLGLAAFLETGPARWGWLPLGLGMLSVMALVGALMGRQRRHEREDTELALWVEGQVPGLESALVTAIESEKLIRQGKSGESLGFSVSLAKAAADRASLVLMDVAPQTLVPRKRFERARLVGFVVGAVVLGAALGAPEVVKYGLHQLVTAPERVEGERTVDVAVSQLELEVILPGYTAQKPRRIARSSGDVTALAGSEVRFSGEALAAVEEVALVLESDPEARWGVKLGAGGTVAGSFKVGRDDRYQFVVVEAGGEVVRERLWRKVTVQADQAPEVSLVLPEADEEVKTEDAVDFFYEASDDLGLGEVALVVEGPSGAEVLRRPVAVAQGGKIAKGSATLQVKELGLKPGERASVLFEARDLNDVTGPGIGRSQPRVLTLYSPETEHDRIVTALKELIEKMLDVLADRLENPVDRARRDLVVRFAEGQGGMMTATLEIVMTLETLGQALALDPLASEGLKSGVLGVRQDLMGPLETERAQLTKWREEPDLVEPAVFVALLAQLNSESEVAMEQGILTLKRLVEAALKDAILEAGRQLLDTQNEMMDILKSLKDNKDPEAIEAAMEKLRALQDKLAELQQKLAKLQERTPYENQNPSQRPSQSQEDAKDMQSQMDEIAKLLAEGKVDEAMKRLEELAKSTQQMMAGLQEELDAFGGGGMSAGAERAMQELKQGLDELADGQRGVQRETDSAKEAIDARQEAEAQEKAKAELDALKAEAKEVREAVERTQREGLHPDDAAALKRLEEAAAALEGAIEQVKLGEAEGQAKDVAGGAKGLAEEVGKSEARETAAGRLKALRAAMKQLGEAAEKANALGDKLGGMRPKPGQGLQPGEQAGLERLEGAEGELEARMKGLKEKMQSLESEQPGAGQAMGEALEGAEQAMGEAKRELGGKDPGKARQRQQEALERLEEAQNKLSEMMEQQQKQSRSGEGGTGVNDPKAKVEIPKEDPYASPRRLREEILRAMQEKAPEGYKDAIKRFYEELTK